MRTAAAAMFMILIAVVFSPLALAITVADLEKLAQGKVDDAVVATMLDMSEERLALSPEDLIRLQEAGLSKPMLKLLVEHYMARPAEPSIEAIIRMQQAGVPADVVTTYLTMGDAASLPEPAAGPATASDENRILLQNASPRRLQFTWREPGKLLEIDTAESSTAVPDMTVEPRAVEYIETPEQPFVVLWKPTGALADLPRLRVGMRLSVAAAEEPGQRRYGLHVYVSGRLQQTFELELEEAPEVRESYDPLRVEHFNDPDHDFILWANRYVADAPVTWRSRYYDAYYPLAPRRPLHNYYLDRPAAWRYEAGPVTYYYGNPEFFPNAVVLPVDDANYPYTPWLGGSNEAGK